MLHSVKVSHDISIAEILTILRIHGSPQVAVDASRQKDPELL